MMTLHLIIDVWQWRRWATVFAWVGANALTVFFLNYIVNFLVGRRTVRRRRLFNPARSRRCPGCRRLRH
jgi:hypothetical protein